jgi:ATP-grasp domain
MTTSPKPVVACLDREPWVSFFEMAVLVRQKGCRAIRFTSDRSHRSVGPSRFAFDKTVTVADWDELTDLGPYLAGGQLLDVLCPERMLTIADRLVKSSAGTTPQLVEMVDARVRFSDKWVASKALVDSGVPVPPALRADEVTPAEAIASLTLPLLVKHRVGAAGSGVVLARTEEELLELMGKRSASQVYYEKLIEGAHLGLGAVFTPSGVVQWASYSRYRTRPELFGPATAVVTLSDGSGRELADKVAPAIGGAGIFELEFIRDEAGRDWVIDANVRPWGSMASLLAAGLDFSEGYLFALGAQASEPVDVTPMADVRAWVLSPPFPRPGEDWGQALVRYLRDSRRRVQRFGLGYFIAETWIRMPGTLKRVRATRSESRKWRRRAAPALAATVSPGS